MKQTRVTLFAAIARRQFVIALYNRKQVKIAPHILFERHGDLYVCALNMSKSWRSDEDRRLGQFKLSGLVGTELLDEKFDPLPAYVSSVPRVDDTLVLAI